MELIKSLDEIRHEIQSLNKAISMLEQLIERENAKGKGAGRQCELFEKSLNEKRESLKALEIKEKQLSGAYNGVKERGIINNSESQERGE